MNSHGNRESGKEQGKGEEEVWLIEERGDRGGNPPWLSQQFTLISRAVPLKLFISSGTFHRLTHTHTHTHTEREREREMMLT